MDDGMASIGPEPGTVTGEPFALGVAPGTIVAGFDVHRPTTVDALDTVTGEVWRGQIQSSEAAVVEWAAQFSGRVVHVAVEACTGWLFVDRALTQCGAVTHLAEPVETSALRGRKRRQDRSHRRAVAARTAGGRPAAGGVDPA